MKRTIQIDLPQNLDNVLVVRATGLDTPETLCATIIAEWCERYAKEDLNAARAVMTPIADALIAAPANIRDKILASATTELKNQGLL